MLAGLNDPPGRRTPPPQGVWLWFLAPPRITPVIRDGRRSEDRNAEAAAAPGTGGDRAEAEVGIGIGIIRTSASSLWAGAPEGPGPSWPLNWEGQEADAAALEGAEPEIKGPPQQEPGGRTPAESGPSWARGSAKSCGPLCADQ